MKNRRGFTLIEVIAVATMVAIVGSLSLISLKRTQIHNRKLEAKAELGFLYQAQKSYFFKNRSGFNDGIEEIMFPKGKKRFNVGYTRHSGSSSQKQNYQEFYNNTPATDASCSSGTLHPLSCSPSIAGSCRSCSSGGDFTPYTPAKSVNNRKDFELISDLSSNNLVEINSSRGEFKPVLDPQKYVAFAIGKILDDPLTANTRSAWEINQDGALHEKCNPMESSPSCTVADINALP